MALRHFSFQNRSPEVNWPTADSLVKTMKKCIRGLAISCCSLQGTRLIGCVFGIDRAIARIRASVTWRAICPLTGSDPSLSSRIMSAQQYWPNGIELFHCVSHWALFLPLVSRIHFFCSSLICLFISFRCPVRARFPKFPLLALRRPVYVQPSLLSELRWMRVFCPLLLFVLCFDPVALLPYMFSFKREETGWPHFDRFLVLWARRIRATSHAFRTGSGWTPEDGAEKNRKKLQAECEERKEPEAVRGKETIYGSTAIWHIVDWFDSIIWAANESEPSDGKRAPTAASTGLPSRSNWPKHQCYTNMIPYVTDSSSIRCLRPSFQWSQLKRFQNWPRKEFKYLSGSWF